MNRADFGKLVASLRKEHDDESGVPWTQAKLAQEANSAVGAQLFSEYIVGAIERGTRHSDPQTLVALADVLQLSTGERREFFLAGSGVGSSALARQDTDPEVVLSHLGQRMQQTYLPSYIIDSYHDIVMSSQAVVELLDLESAGLGPHSQYGNPFPHNAVRFAFWNSDEEEGYLANLIGRDWPNNLFQTMLMFRATTLRYRSTQYFQALLWELKKCRQFLRYWQFANLEDSDHFVESIKVSFNSPKWGPLAYYHWHLRALTSAGELYLCVYVPTTHETAGVFSDIVRQCRGAPLIRMESWPDKRLPE